MYKETRFVLLGKFCKLCAVPAKSVRLHIIGNNIEPLQNASHYLYHYAYYYLWYLEN